MADGQTQNLVNLTIEGRTVSVPAGISILEAAKQVGVLIPHYCYHPGLPVAGVCRMCLVEVEKAPKLAPSCATSSMKRTHRVQRMQRFGVYITSPPKSSTGLKRLGSR